MKKVISVLLAAAMSFLCLCPALAAGDISVTVDGVAVVWTDVKPFIDENGRTLCPLRAVADAMGLEVEWHGDDSPRAAFSRTEKSDRFAGDCVVKTILSFSIGQSIAAYEEDYYVNGAFEANGHYPIYMDTAAVIVNDRTYAPVRYLAEAYGYTVGWDPATRTVAITSA